MKTTYLMDQEQPDGNMGLAVVTSVEWLTAVRQTKHLPVDQRRYFIIDYIADGDDLDRMVIEVPIEDYREWHHEHMASEQSRRNGRNLQKFSMDMQLFGVEDVESLQNVLSSGEDIENMVYERMLMDDLRQKLAAWRGHGATICWIFTWKGRQENCVGG